MGSTMHFQPYTKTCLDTNGKRNAKTSYIQERREQQIFSFVTARKWRNYCTCIGRKSSYLKHFHSNITDRTRPKKMKSGEGNEEISHWRLIKKPSRSNCRYCVSSLPFICVFNSWVRSKRNHTDNWKLRPGGLFWLPARMLLQ